ncbi:MAG: hypothetical protein ACIAQF_08515, partial [Phycisphaerales bacterium JB065]
MNLSMLHTLAETGTEATPAIVEKLQFVIPELAMFVGTCVVMMLGLSKSLAVRKACRPATILTLAIAGGIAAFASP